MQQIWLERGIIFSSIMLPCHDCHVPQLYKIPAYEFISMMVCSTFGGYFLKKKNLSLRVNDFFEEILVYEIYLRVKVRVHRFVQLGILFEYGYVLEWVAFHFESIPIMKRKEKCLKYSIYNVKFNDNG